MASKKEHEIKIAAKAFRESVKERKKKIGYFVEESPGHPDDKRGELAIFYYLPSFSSVPSRVA